MLKLAFSNLRIEKKYLSFETPIYKSKLELLFMRYLDKS